MFIAALFTIARSWKQPKCPSTDEWIKKIWYIIYNGILLSHKKERNWVICRDVDGSRDCHSEWSKSEREKQISYINPYMWNLEKWYRWTGWQGRNWDTVNKLCLSYCVWKSLVSKILYICNIFGTCGRLRKHGLVKRKWVWAYIYVYTQWNSTQP